MSLAELAPVESAEDSSEQELSSEEFYNQINGRVSAALDRAEGDNLWANFEARGVRGDLHLEKDGSLVIIVPARVGRHVLSQDIIKQYNGQNPENRSRFFAVSYYPEGPGMHGFLRTPSHTSVSFPRMQLDDTPEIRGLFEQVVTDVETRSHAQHIGQVAV